MSFQKFLWIKKFIVNDLSTFFYFLVNYSHLKGNENIFTVVWAAMRLRNGGDAKKVKKLSDNPKCCAS